MSERQKDLVATAAMLAAIIASALVNKWNYDRVAAKAFAAGQAQCMKSDGGSP